MGNMYCVSETCPDRHFGLLKLGWQTMENLKKKGVM